MAEWNRVVNTTLINFLKKEEVNIMRNRKLPALIQEMGRATFNWSGRETEQRIRFRRVPMVAYADMDVVQFARQDRWKLANLPIRGYSIADAVSKKERLMNKGKEAIINLFSDIGKGLKEDLADQFHEELYVDGNASGNIKKLHGIESFMNNGTTITVADGYKCPDDSYAGIDTDPSAYGGTWTGTWPNGSGDAQYDFWAPVLIDYTHATAFSDGATFASNCKQSLRTAILTTQRSGGKDGMLDIIIVDRAMYQNFLDKLDDLERIVVNRGQDSTLVKMGFRDVVQHDGVDVTWEYGITANIGYGLNLKKCELRSWQKQLFTIDGPDYDAATKTDRLCAEFWGNMFWNPRYQAKLKNYT